MTEKYPCQSVRELKASVMILPTALGEGIGKRNSTMPQGAGKPNRHASSPKSLSNVRRTRASALARSSTLRSELPGASVRIQATSLPAERKVATALPGKFFVCEKAHHHAIAAGYTFSDCRISAAYWKQAAISS